MVPLRQMMSSTAPSMAPSPVTTTPAAALTHHRSLSSHPILLSTGPPLSSLPVHLGPASAATRLSRAEAVLTTARSSTPSQPRKDTADSAVTVKGGMVAGSGASARRLSPTRSVSEADGFTIHHPTAITPPGAAAVVGSMAAPPPPLPSSGPAILPRPTTFTGAASSGSSTRCPTFSVVLVHHCRLCARFHRHIPDCRAHASVPTSTPL